uniref:Ras-GAP domain-containing protein n=1 Tax=Echinostoma caproni TaxID=27848 RepID=A0A183AUE6_9TREM
LAGSVVAFQQAIGQAPQFLVVMILHEVHKQADPNMVLRGNSIATKATEIYLRLIGETYLSRVLADFVQTVLSGSGGACTVGTRRATEPQTGKTSKQGRMSSSNGNSGTLGTFPDCEVDAAKLQSSSQLAQNQANLKNLVETVWDRIVTSEAYFPEKLRMIFAAVRNQLDTIYPPGTMKSSDPSQATLSEHVISACVFLRYICPAILSPSLFGLTAEFPSEPRVLRAFTLVAKTIQSLANFSLFAGSKEVYMTFMNPFVSSQLPAMRRFLYAISSPPLQLHRPINDPVSLPPHLDGTMSLTQSICLPPASLGINRTLLTSHSHHGAFLGDPSHNGVSSDCFSDPSSRFGRAGGGLPSGTPADRHTGPDQLTHFETGDLSCVPVLLPHLPRFDTDSQLGDHVDLALCLALCHLQLSEAIQKVPAENASPHIAKIKPVLEEIDFFLKSGVEPSSNWWPQDFVSQQRRSDGVPVNSTPATSSSPTSNSVSATMSSSSIRFNRSQGASGFGTDSKPSDYLSGITRLIQNSDRLDYDNPVQQPLNGNHVEATSNPPTAARSRIAPFELVHASFFDGCPRSPSQKAFVTKNRNSPPAGSHVVRSRSGSELMRGGNEGQRYVAIPQLTASSKENHSVPQGTSNPSITKEHYSNGFLSYEQIPRPPPYSVQNSEPRAMVQSLGDSPQGVTNSSVIAEDGSSWTIDRDLHMVAATVAEVPVSTKPEPAQLISVMHSHGPVALANSDKRYVAIPQLTASSKENHSVPQGTSNPSITKEHYSNGFLSYEQIPRPPPYSVQNSEPRAMVQSLGDSPQGVTNSSVIAEDGSSWTIDRDLHMVAATVAEVPVSTKPEPAQLISVMHSHGPVALANSDNPTHLTHMYATHSSSSGYQSLRSHDTATARAVCQNGAYGPAYDYQMVLTNKEPNQGIPRPPAQSSAVAMSNPLYAFHDPRPSALSPIPLSSPDESDLSPQDPRSPPIAQAIPTRVKLATPRSARRHTYVNLASAANVEAVFAFMRPPHRRASITSDPAVPPMPNTHDASSPERRRTVLEGSELNTAAPTGSLTTLSSAPIDSIATPEHRTTTVPTRTHSTHRPNSTDDDLVRQVTTMHATVEGLDLRIPSAAGSLKLYPTTEKRTALFQTDPAALDPDSIRDELDASQARLAEAQARLLANEAERIQLLRAWHNELMKQSQLVTYGSRGS